MLWDLEDFEDQTYENALHVFTMNIHTDNYFVTIKTPMVHQLAIKYIGIGISLIQIVLALQATKKVVMIFKLGGIIDIKIATIVPIQCGANFQIIYNILCMVWVFSITLHASTCMGTSYIDVRARFVWRRQL